MPRQRGKQNLSEEYTMPFIASNTSLSAPSASIWDRLSRQVNQTSTENGLRKIGSLRPDRLMALRAISAACFLQDLASSVSALPMYRLPDGLTRRTFL